MSEALSYLGPICSILAIGLNVGYFVGRRHGRYDNR